ncbi:MAG TPA: NUDIX hydrolase [Chloroflexota bacterium]|nr:NUDIX hydrolase [Chloroflexota bacterium]
MSAVPRKALGAAAVIFDAQGRVLLVKHTYGMLNWELPGGFAEADESPVDTATREVREETGLTVTASRLTGVYYEPASPGIGGEMVHFVFLCQTPDERQAPRPAPPEIDRCEFWQVDNLPRPISDFTVRRIQDAGRPTTLLPLTIAARAWLV